MDGLGPLPKQSTESAAAPFREQRPRPNEVVPAARTDEGLAIQSPPPFRESSAVPLDRERLLKTRVKDLALQITGTTVEKLVDQLYKELAAVGIGFRPPCYLSDEWGCPDSKPIIGIPFYLADEKLGLIEGEVSEVRETESESIIYLRHEAGHAFCYAHELYKREDFHALFGPYTRPYLEEYKVQPFSRSYVRHIPGWYAQKHPDEDFAETFAVYLTPGSNWRETYKGWPALRKLEYVEARIAELGAGQPKVLSRTPDLGDVPVEAMEETVGELFEREGPPEEVGRQLSTHFDGDLREIFAAPGAHPAAAGDVIDAGRRQIITSVAYWTGLARPAVKAMVLHLIARLRALKLSVQPGAEAESLARFSVLVTTLAMNRVYSGKFCEL